MSSDGSILEIYEEEKRSPSDAEKQPDIVVENSAVSSSNDLSSMSLKEVAEMEEKLAGDEAPDEAFRVQEAYEVALKVLSTRDDPELPALTFRTVFLGLGFSAFGAVLAQIYYFKPQTLLVSVLFLQVITYWVGMAMHLMMPSKGFFRHLNPGVFNIKEHAAIIIMSSTAASSATAIQVISVQELYYNNHLNPGLAIFTCIGSQLIGYGFAGILHDILVKPTKCFWPYNISTANLFQALHYDRQMSSKRTRVFWIVFSVLFCWEIVPEFIFPLLTGVSIICLADNTSSVVRNVFGGASNNEGLGLLEWCFDWNYITSTSMYSPIWLQVNQDIGIVFTYFLMAGLYYGNVWNGKQFPFMSQAIFAANGSQYNQTALLTDGKFNPEKYAELGPAYFSASNALYIVTGNLSMGAILTHVILYHWNDVKPVIFALNPWNKNSLEVHDAHFEKMKVYKQIPRWWYFVVLAAAYAIAQATNYKGNSGMPWWALTILLFISFFFCVLYGIMAATIGFTQFNTSGTSFFQMITGYIVPGRPVANMYGALYGQHPMTMAIALLQDLKLGQYVKLAPRVTFLMQMSGTVVGAVLNYIMMLSIIENNRADLLSIAGTRLWSGQNAQSYNSAAIAWGALGQEMFGPHGTYHIVPVALAIGLFLPFPFYIAHRKWPKVGFNNINTSIIMQYSAFLSVGINSSVNPSMVIGIFSQWWVRTRYPRWFIKYNYIVGAAMDGGTQVVMFILNFALFGAAGHATTFPQWWGNDLNLSADRCAAPSQ